MRVVEVYAGAYASGKSETAVNRARQFAMVNKSITLVDLDTVEPAYTLRPIAKNLAQMGINVITQPDNFGLGEAASYVTPAQINCLSQGGDIIIDVGYGAGGLDILDIWWLILQNLKPLLLKILLNMLILRKVQKNNIHSAVQSLIPILVMKQPKKML